MEIDSRGAWQLLNEYTKSDSLLKHALAVEAAVRGYARSFGEDEDGWGIVALLHDFDYERWPSAEDHPFRGVEILRGQGYPEWVTRAILSHADYSGVPRESQLEKDAVRVRRDGRLRHRGVAGAAQQERPRSGGRVGRQADEGQGLCARRSSGTTCEPAPSCSVCRSTRISAT